MPMIMPSMAFASQRQDNEQASRIGIDVVYNRVSRLLQADVNAELPKPMFEPTQPAKHHLAPTTSLS